MAAPIAPNRNVVLHQVAVARATAEAQARDVWWEDMDYLINMAVLQEGNLNSNIWGGVSNLVNQGSMLPPSLQPLTVGPMSVVQKKETIEKKSQQQIKINNALIKRIDNLLRKS